MPMVIPVVAGAWAMASAATVTTIMGALQFAGGFLTVVGGLSGDKDAMKMGSILGLAGGIGGAIDKAATSNAAGQAASEGANATAGNTIADNVGSTSVDSMVGPPAELAGSGAGGLSPADVGIGMGGAADGGSGLIGEASGLAGDVPGMADLNAMGDVGMGVDQATDVARMGDVGMGAAGDSSRSALFSNKGYGDGMSGEATRIFDEGAQSSADSKWGSLSEMFGGAEKWMKENPNLVKFGGGIVKGAMDYVGNRQQIKDRLEAEKSYKDWVRQRYSDSVRNLVIPSPIGVAPANAGIISGQRG